MGSARFDHLFHDMDAEWSGSPKVNRKGKGKVDGIGGIEIDGWLTVENGSGSSSTHFDTGHDSSSGSTVKDQIKGLQFDPAVVSSPKRGWHFLFTFCFR